MTQYRSLLFLLLSAVMGLSAVAAVAQEMEEIELERSRRDFEQLVETRLAGTAVRAHQLQEQAQESIRIGSRGDEQHPECEKVSPVSDYDVLTAELITAMKSTESRLTDDYRSYDAGLREYDAHSTTDSWKINRHFALRLQRQNIRNLESRQRSLRVIANSWRRTLPNTATAVATASCLVARQGPTGENLGRLLTTSLLGIIHEYRETLYNVQR
jgi:hypothetical protein